jgi:pimeloyl-ACP methyl ester carboxylesterase
MYYEEHGEGEPLILLHGGMETGRDWDTTRPFFAEHFRVVVPDCRGHGRTDNPTGEFSYRLMADDVAALVQALGLVKPSIWGYSQGAHIALEIGMWHPSLARALVVNSTQWQYSDAYFDRWRTRGFLGPGLAPILPLPPEDAERWQGEHFRPGDPDYWKTLVRQLSVMWLTPLAYTAEGFQKIITPTLVLVGDRDEWVPVDEALRLYHLVTNAELAIMPYTTHGPFNQTILTSIVLDFLLRHSSPAER